MARKVIRLGELASFPSKDARLAQPATAGKRGQPAEQATMARAGKLPVSPATIWRWGREGKFPKPFKLSNGVTVWDEAEVDAFIAARAKGDA